VKITVIGAGPSGLLASHLLKKAGHEISIIEEHKIIGRPVSCSGLIGKDYFDYFNNFNFKESILNRIDGAIVNLGGESFELKRKGVSYVVDRSTFDQTLSKGLDVSLDEILINMERSVQPENANIISKFFSYLFFNSLEEEEQYRIQYKPMWMGSLTEASVSGSWE